MVENLNEKIQINLKGFSGNKIEVLRSHGNTYVRKTAKDLSQNNRMQLEIKKLEKLLEVSDNCDNFKIPKIISVKKNRYGLLVYESEFIPGESLDHCLYKSNSEKIKFFSDELKKIIDVISENSIQSKINERDFLLQKFYELITELNKKKISTELCKNLSREYIKKIENLIINKTNLTNKSTFCHGDLALDNIIITRKNEIYLIDPLHNDFESFMWDYAKVLQSSMTHWNLIKYHNFQILTNERKIRLQPNEHIAMFHQYFIKNLDNYNHSTVILYLAATLARVAKYTNTEKQLCALLIIINELLTNYSNGRSDLSGTLNSLRW